MVSSSSPVMCETATGVKSNGKFLRLEFLIAAMMLKFHMLGV